MNSKICIKCKKEKHLIHFHKDNRTKDKHNSMCKECKKKYSKKTYKKYYWAHKEEQNKRAQMKRDRNFGYEPINKREAGNVGHHMDKNLVIYIPEELHKSVIHAQDNMESMKEINILAVQLYYI